MEAVEESLGMRMNKLQVSILAQRDLLEIKAYIANDLEKSNGGNIDRKENYAENPGSERASVDGGTNCIDFRCEQ